MEIGLHLPSAQAGANAGDILGVATGAEGLGFDSLWMFDHIFTPKELESAYPYSKDGSYALTDNDPFFDPLGLFGVLAGATDRIKLGTGVLIAAYRHPLILGKVLATIERFAPGRLVLGVGAGWMREEFEAVGLSLADRGARLDEYLEALRAIWSGEPAGFEGRFYSWAEAGLQPAPTRPIPIIVGGHSDAALRRAARAGDGWAVVTGKGQGSGLDAVERRLATLDGFLEEQGRSRDGFELMFAHGLFFVDEPHPKFPLVGTPESITESLLRLRDMGVTMVDLITFGDAEAILTTASRFAEEVRPKL